MTAAATAVPTVDQIETAATVMIAADAATAAAGTRRGKDLETVVVVVEDPVEDVRNAPAGRFQRIVQPT